MKPLFKPYYTNLSKPKLCLDDVVRDEIEEGWHLDLTIFYNDYEPFQLGVAYVKYDENLPPSEREHEGYQIATFPIGEF